MSRFIILCHCLAWVLTLPANTIYGARAPVAIKRTFVLRGDAAVALGALFDLSVENHSSCLLRLGKFESQAALYLDEHAEAPPDDGDNVRELYNLMEFATESGPLLSISPYWRDTSTQEPAPEWNKLGGFSFGSQEISLTLTNDDPWTRLIKRLSATDELKPHLWQKTTALLFSRLFQSSDGTKFTLEIYRFGEVYRGIITAWPKQSGLTAVTRGYPITDLLTLAAIVFGGLLLYLRWRRAHRSTGG